MLNWDLSRHFDSLEWCLLKILHWLANPGSLLASSHDNTGYDIYHLSLRANIDRDHVTKPRDCLTYRKFQNCDSVERIYYKIDFIRYSLSSLFITLGCLLFFATNRSCYMSFCCIFQGLCSKLTNIKVIHFK